MKLKTFLLGAALLTGLGLTGCDRLRSLTEPSDGLTGPYTFSVSTNLSNTSGMPTLIDAEILIDDNVVADSCPQEDLSPQTDSEGNVTYFCQAPATNAVDLSSTGHIGPGQHTMLFFISSQTVARTPTPYAVRGFDFRVSDGQGNLIESIALPAQSASLAAGQSIAYTIRLK